MTDIPMNRNEYSLFLIGGKGKGHIDGDKQKPAKGSYRKYKCPVCGLIARTTKDAILKCGACEVEMLRAQ